MGSFATAINCMDGRVQEPLARWMKDKFGVEYVDVITEAGPDKYVTTAAGEKLEALKTKIGISVEKHGSTNLVIAGHHDCGGNPVDRETHLQEVRQSMQIVKDMGFPIAIYGVWIDENWTVHLIEEWPA